MTTINNIGQKDIVRLDARKLEPVKTSESKESESAESTNTDNVTLSTQSTNEVPFDQAKVERIKAQISSGTYQINPEKIADKILESLRK